MKIKEVVPHINLDGKKPDNVPQEQWDRLKQGFDETYEDESEESKDE